MSVGYQGDLFGTAAEPSLARLRGTVQRTTLAHGAWVDVRRSWVTGADEVFETLARRVPWRAEQREMYERVVAVPRLVHVYAEDDPLPHRLLTSARQALTNHYLAELGEPFATAGCCFYRDGQDSVAWHGDRIGRGQSEDTMVAILSFGDPRRLLLRPDGGGASLAFTLGHGDLLVMGGSCQRTWEHCVPKVASAGPRISVQFRPAGVL